MDEFSEFPESPDETEISGTLTHRDGAVDVAVEHHYAAPADRLWSALTRPEELAQWFAAVQGELAEGGRYHIRFNPDDPDQQVNGSVDYCKHGERLVLSWEMEGHPESTVSADLAADGDGSVLHIAHHNMREDTAAAYAAGWQSYAEALTGYLAGETDLRQRWELRWQQLLPLYLHRVSAV